MGHLFMDNKGHEGILFKKNSIGVASPIARTEAPRWGFQLGLNFLFISSFFLFIAYFGLLLGGE